MCQIIVFKAINTIVIDMERNIGYIYCPVVVVRTSGNYIVSTGPTTTTGQSVYPDIALHISNYHIHIHVGILLPQSTSASFSAYYIVYIDFYLIIYIYIWFDCLSL